MATNYEPLIAYSPIKGGPPGVQHTAENVMRYLRYKTERKAKRARIRDTVITFFAMGAGSFVGTLIYHWAVR